MRINDNGMDVGGSLAWNVMQSCKYDTPLLVIRIRRANLVKVADILRVQTASTSVTVKYIGG